MPPHDKYITLRSVFAWLVIPAIIGGVGFAHGSIWAHDKEIAILKTRQEGIIQTIRENAERADKRAERMENLLTEMLKEMRK